MCACVGGWVGGRAKRTCTHSPIYSCTGAFDTGAFDHDEDVSPPGPPPPDLPSTNGFDYDLLSKLHFQNLECVDEMHQEWYRLQQLFLQQKHDKLACEYVLIDHVFRNCLVPIYSRDCMELLAT